MGLATLPLRALLLAACASGLHFAQRAPAVARSREVVMMGRKFENNKMKMAKTALAFAKKASYIGKKVIIVVKDGGDDPDANLALAAVMREANALNVPKDVRSTASPPHRQPPHTAWYYMLIGETSHSRTTERLDSTHRPPASYGTLSTRQPQQQAGG